MTVLVRITVFVEVDDERLGKTEEEILEMVRDEFDAAPEPEDEEFRIASVQVELVE